MGRACAGQRRGGRLVSHAGGEIIRRGGERDIREFHRHCRRVSRAVDCRLRAPQPPVGHGRHCDGGVVQHHPIHATIGRDNGIDAERRNGSRRRKVRQSGCGHCGKEVDGFQAAVGRSSELGDSRVVVNRRVVFGALDFRAERAVRQRHFGDLQDAEAFRRPAVFAVCNCDDIACIDLNAVIRRRERDNQILAGLLQHAVRQVLRLHRVIYQIERLRVFVDRLIREQLDARRADTHIFRLIFVQPARETGFNFVDA